MITIFFCFSFGSSYEFLQNKIILVPNVLNLSATESSLSGMSQYMADYKASNPICGEEAAVNSIIGGFISIVSMIITFMIFGASGKTMIASAMISLSMFIAANSDTIACLFSFVKHPVKHDNTGNMLTCKDPYTLEEEVVNDQGEKETITLTTCPNDVYDITDKYEWPKNADIYSNYIWICNRLPIGALRTSAIGCRLDETTKEWDKSCDNGDLNEREFEYLGPQNTDDLVNAKAVLGSDLKCKKLKEGDAVYMHAKWFTATQMQGKLCVKLSGWLANANVGCHKSADLTIVPMCESSIAIVGSNGEITSFDNSPCYNCYIDPACFGASLNFSHARIPITTSVIGCLKETVENLLSASGCNGQKGLLYVFTDYIMTLINILIIFAIILLGYKVFMADISYSDFSVFILKVALILFFLNGDVLSLYYRGIVNLSNVISSVLLRLSNSNLCNTLSPDEYTVPSIRNASLLTEKELAAYNEMVKNNTTYTDPESIYNNAGDLGFDPSDTAEIEAFANKVSFKSYLYLSVWDVLDCRIHYYLGASIGVAAVTATAAAVAAIPVAGIFFVILPMIFSGYIFIAALVLGFVIMIMALIIHLTHIYIIAFVAYTIIAMFAPIFIPMILFTYTKPMFDSWVKQLVAYSLYPIILFGFLGMVFVLFDKIYFGDFKFIQITKEIIYPDGVHRKYYEYELENTDSCNGMTESKPFACFFADMQLKDGNFLGLFNITKIAGIDGQWGALMSMTARVFFLAFLFHSFLKILGGLAATLAGEPRANVGAHAVSVDKIAKQAVKVLKAGAEPAKAATEAVMNRVKGGGNESGSQGDGSSSSSRSGNADSGDKK